MVQRHVRCTNIVSAKFTTSMLMFIALLFVIMLTTIITSYSEQKPIDRTIKNTVTIICNAEGLTHLIEVNLSYYTTWFIDYVNPINISVKPLSVLDKPLTLVAVATLDKITTSKFLGYLREGDILQSSIEIPITSSTIQISAEREVKELRLTFNITEVKCRYSIPLWIIVAKITSAINIGVDVEPDVVEVGQAVELRISLTNPSPELLTNVDVYVYVNNSIIYSNRIPIIRPYEDIIIANSIRYIAEKPGVYLVKARAIYASPSATQGASDAVAVFTAKLRPILTISANKTIAKTGEAILLTGSIEPRIEDEKTVELDVSFDGINWRSIAKLKLFNNNFSYNFVPEEPRIHYIRFRLTESKLFLPGISNTISIVVEKIRPYVSINIEWPFVEEGSNISIKVKVDPPIVETIEIMYRISGESSWRKTQTKIGKGIREIAVSLGLTQPGIYEIKAVVPETKSYYGTESNILQVYVRPREKSEITTQIQVQTSTEIPIELRRNTMFIVILVAFATATAILFLALRR